MEGTWLVVQLRPQMSIIIRQIIHQIGSRNDQAQPMTEADPGFPVGGGHGPVGGGHGPVGGRVWTSDEGAFQQKCVQKQKNWVL